MERAWLQGSTAQLVPPYSLGTPTPCKTRTLGWGVGALTEINVEAEQVAEQGCGQQAQKDEQGSQSQDSRSLGLHRGGGQEHEPHIRVVLQGCEAQTDCA